MAKQGSSQVSPADAVVAMRTWPRRYRAALAPIADDRIADKALRIGPQGVSALDLAVNSLGTWVLLEKALHDIRVTECPTLHPAVTESAARSWESHPTETLDSVLDQIDDVANSLANSIEAMPSDDWPRKATVAGGGTTTALALAREAVNVGADNLREIERVIAAVN